MKAHPVILNFILLKLGLIKPFGSTRTEEERAIIHTLTVMPPTEAAGMALTLADIHNLPEFVA